MHIYFGRAQKRIALQFLHCLCSVYVTAVFIFILFFYCRLHLFRPPLERPSEKCRRNTDKTKHLLHYIKLQTYKTVGAIQLNAFRTERKSKDECDLFPL